MKKTHLYFTLIVLAVTFCIMPKSSTAQIIDAPVKMNKTARKQARVAQRIEQKIVRAESKRLRKDKYDESPKEDRKNKQTQRRMRKHHKGGRGHILKKKKATF